MIRTVGHRIHGRIEVFAFADSIAEAVALEGALKAVPPGEAFSPDPESIRSMCAPSAPTLEEVASRAPQALADIEDAAPVPMPHDEAVAR